MFKKRTGNNKAVNLNEEINQIKAQNVGEINTTAIEIQNMQNEVPKQPIGNENYQPFHLNLQNNFIGKEYTTIPQLKIKKNNISLQALEKDFNIKKYQENTHPKQMDIVQKQQVQMVVEEQEMQACFNQIKKMKDQEQTIENNNAIYISDDDSEENKNVRKDHSFIVVDEIGGYQQFQREIQPEKDGLEIEEDFQGGFSPVRDDSENMLDEDYEDELIRKTLTKENFMRVNKSQKVSLHEMKRDKVKSKMLESILATSKASIQRQMARDIYIKKNKIAELEKQYQYLNEQSQQRKKQVVKKNEQMEDLEQKLSKINKVIEYVYYYGDKIKKFQINSVYEQAAPKQIDEESED